MMEARKIQEADRSWFVTPFFQWHELLKARTWNWVNLDLCSLQFEYGTYKGRYLEIHFAILGVGFDFEWFDRTQRSVFLADMDQRIAECRDMIDVVGDDADDAE